jgi:hypothetical protein
MSPLSADPAVTQVTDRVQSVGHRDRQAARSDGRAVARVGTRHGARKVVHGLLADLLRKNCWTIAEHAGETAPHGTQHFLARANWDTDYWSLTRPGT